MTIPSAITAEQEVTANVYNVVAVLGAKDMRILAMSESLGISVTNACYTCYMLNELCMDCEDNRLTREAIMAHEIVDDGSDIYRYAPMYTSLTKIEPEASGHDWVGAVTRIYGDKERNEFLEPITVITDRIFDMGFDMPANSIVCQDCHYTFNKHTICPNCN